MSPVQKQRIIGAILLFSGIAGIALFLMSNASSTDPVPDEVSSHVNEEYVSVVEAMPEGDIEIVEDTQETLVDIAKKPISAKTLSATPNDSQLKPVTKAASISDEINVIAEQLENKSVKKLNTADETSLVVKKTPQWILQIAGFSVRENADKLNRKLLFDKYSSFIDPVKTSTGKVIYRVRIGPHTDKAKLEQIAVKLNQKFQLQPQLLQQSN